MIKRAAGMTDVFGHTLHRKGCGVVANGIGASTSRLWSGDAC
jgi:hypothetical protein